MRDVGAMLGSGGVIVSNEDQCAVDLARVLVAFCQFESCGKCFPCRLGMTHLLDMVENISKFDATASDLDLIGTIGNTMEAGSLCFHGQLGVNPIRSAVEQFPEDFRIHIEEKRCPTGSCDRPITVPRNLRPFGENASRNQIPLKLPSSIPNPT
jgi:NADH-quinone oxidoreductase subunit F/NADP-reducing hydrogenase subunit HndC